MNAPNASQLTPSRRIAILTAIKPEYTEVRKLFPPGNPRPKTFQPYRTDVTIGKGKKRQRLRIGVFLIGKGPANAAAGTVGVLLDFRPTDLVLVGVAGGLSKSHSISDALGACAIDRQELDS